MSNKPEPSPGPRLKMEFDMGLNQTKKQKIISLALNFIKNLMAYALPVAVLQFIIQPGIADKVGSEKNGLIATIMALNYFVTSVTAGIIMQTRLLQNEKYEKEGLVGDYSIILTTMAVVNSTVMTVGTWLYMGASANPMDIAFCVILGLLFLIHDYVVVQYRIELNFTKILISNIILCVGYAVGILVFWLAVPQWQIVYIIAYGICEIYDLSNTSCWREPFRRTKLFTETLKKYAVLAGANLLSYLVSYGDRLILYPLTDGTSVTILTCAEIMGKMLMLLSTPLTGFLLSYMVKEDKISLNIGAKYWLFIIAGLGVCYGLCYLVSIPLLYLLYPDWAHLSMQYVPLTTLNSLIQLIAHVANVIVVRFCKSRWQVVINGAYLAIYLVMSLTLLYFFGLMGFVIGNIIASVAKLAIIAIIAKTNIKSA